MEAFTKITFLWLSLILLFAYCKGINSIILCNDKEKQALLDLKSSLIDQTNRLSTWSSSEEADNDCCKWSGVKCNNITGHVTELYLGTQINHDPQPLHGEISNSLLELEFLSYLDLSGNNFNGAPIPSFFGDVGSLTYLNLSNAWFSGLIPENLGSISNLTYLDLSLNHLQGQIPNTLGQLMNLVHLNISNNDLSGTIPPSLGNLPSLKILCLSCNNLVDTLPTSLGDLSSLEIFAVNNNSLSGTISEINFLKNSNLKLLNVTSNFFTFNFSNDWIPPFQLEALSIGICTVGPSFPTWLKTQTNLRHLYMYQSEIVGKLPSWFWNWAAQLDHLDLSFNQIQGDLSNVLLNSTYINLRTNYFEGQLPNISPHVIWLSVANNSFSGTITSFFCQKNHSNNNLKLFHAPQNSLSGNLTDCWKNWQSLIYLNLGYNHLSGRLSPTLGSLTSLQSLHLHENNLLSGEIPSSFENLTSLRYINLNNNQISGNVPTWVGEKLTSLSLLSIRTNKLTGEIPTQLCQLSFLTVLDLAENGLSGLIPSCFNNLSLMVNTQTPQIFNFSIIIHTPSGEYVGDFEDYIELFTKNVVNLYDKILRLLRIIDFSSNKLSGSIPNQICDLRGLLFLNLSMNQVTGMIPEGIGNLVQLEFLDLSRNLIYGEIPQSITMLTSLAMLNLSYNNLSGKIPRSTQMQSVEISSYIGNVGLCGAPLTVKCTDKDQTSLSPKDDGNGKISEWSIWFLEGMGSGFVVGFLGVGGVLFFKIRTWNLHKVVCVR